MRVTMIVPGQIDRTTGGSIYDKRLRDYLRGNGVETRVISVPDPAYGLAMICSPLVSLAVAARLAGQNNDLIIIDAWAHPCLLPFILARRAERKTGIVLIVHQLRWGERKTAWGRRIASALERAALRSADLVITVSRFMRANIESLAADASNVIVARPGCDEPRERGGKIRGEKKGPGVRLLFVGNCTPRKGLDYLFEALSVLKDPLVTLDVVGDFRVEPAYTQRLRRLAREAGIGDAIRFHGRVSDEALRSFYERADLFVMPSLYEGYGMVYAEAMRAGLPVVATGGGPLPEITRDGENAILVPPADSGRLAEAIGRLASDGDLRSRFARRSLELARDLPTWSATCGQILETLRSLVQSNRSP
jgi:glycosyltransferase involved in cell wall biosynthesis